MQGTGALTPAGSGAVGNTAELSSIGNINPPTYVSIPNLKH